MEMPSGRTQDMNFMFTKLVVADIEKSAAFYSAVFGFVEMHRLEARIMDRPVSEIVYMPTHAGGPLFVLAQFAESSGPVTSELMLGLSSADIDAAIDRVVQAGGRVLEPVQESAPGMRHAFVADPEGHVVQISQMAG